MKAISLDEIDSWGKERSVGEAAVTPTLVVPVAAQPADAPRPMPALLYVNRVRHNGQYLFTGGWIIDDNALYNNAVTLLVAQGPSEVVSVSDGESADAMRRTVTTELTRERSTLGSMTYDGELNEEMLGFLPPGHRKGEGRERLIGGARAVGRRSESDEKIRIALAGESDGSPEQTLQTTVLPVDNPIVHLLMAKCDKSPCSRCPEGCKNLVPAVNNQSSR